MKKPMIKALAFATAITMVFSTPLTALADGLASLYAEGSAEGTGTGSGTGDEPIGTGTGTKEDHDINGEPVDEEVYFKLIGVLLDKPEMTVIAGEQYEEDVLTATLVMQRGTSDVAGRIQTVQVNSSNLDIYGNVKVMVNGETKTTNEILQKSIVWDVADSGKDIVRLERATKEDNRQVKVIGQKQGYADVTVGIYGTDYEATSHVKVKSYSKVLSFKQFGKMYVKHTIDVKNDYFTQDGNDDITWSVNEVGKRGKSTSYASINANGVLTLKKVSKDKKLEVIATSEKGITKASDPFVIEAGNPVTKLKMSGTKTFTLPKDKATDFTVSVTTKNGSETTDFIKWTSSNDKVVTVVEKKSNVAGESKTATVTPVGPGKATITATATSGKKATIKVTVKAPLQKIVGIKREGSDHIYTGQKVQLVALTDPGVCDEASKIKFKLTDKKRDGKLATVSSKGVLQTKKEAGVIEVTASYKDKTGTFKLTIEQNKLTNVTITKLPDSTLTGKPTIVYIADQKKPHQLDVDINKDATKDMVCWSSSNTKVATVDQTGLITPLKPGKVKITASGADVKDVKEIVIQQAVERIELNKSNVTIPVKNSAKKYTTTLKVSKQYPKGVKKENVRWSIASISVDNGKTFTVINGTDDRGEGKTNLGIAIEKGKLTLPGEVKNGTIVKVRAFCDNGATATATVTVCNPTQKVTIAAGKTHDLTIGKEPYNLDSKTITVEAKKGFTEKEYNEKIVSYTANNNNVKLVRIKDGYAVYGVKAGKSVVTVKTASGKSAKITFTVKNN